MQQPSDKAKPFLTSQTFRLLLDQNDPLKYISLQGLRSAGEMGSNQPYPWFCISRQQLANRTVVAPEFSRVANASKTMTYSMDRVIITGDGGTGKTANVQQLVSMLNQLGQQESDPDQRGRIAIRILLTEISEPVHNFGRDLFLPIVRSLLSSIKTTKQPNPKNDKLAKLLANLVSNDNRNEFNAWLDRLQRTGKIDLIIDGLDQVGTESTAAKWLSKLLIDPDWLRCRIFVAGRPYSIKGIWESVLSKSPKQWQFIAIDEFDEDQQKALLGKKRWEAVPMEARSLLSNPRALDYIRTRIPEEELESIRSAAQLFFKATDHMLRESIQNSVRGSMLGTLGQSNETAKPLQASLEKGRHLLAALALEMTFGPRLQQSREGELPTAEPNFRAIEPGYEFEEFIANVRKRLNMDSCETDRRLFRSDLDALAALNTWLQQGFLDSDAATVEGLDQILWRDRTLQEFWTAVYLTRWSTKEDIANIGDWLYLPYNDSTHGYQMIWQFVCDMPLKPFHAPESWLRTAAAVFEPGDGTIQGTRRSTEMIYRAWESLEHYCNGGNKSAVKIRERFLGEFRLIVDGPDSERANQARQLQSSFITVPAEIPFRMGTPIEKQGMPDQARQYWRWWLDHPWSNIDDAIEHVTGHWQYAPGKTGDYYRQRNRKRLIEFRESRDLNAIEEWLYTLDETPSSGWIEPKLPNYNLNALPVLRGWYGLFDPGHGNRGEWYSDKLNKIAPTASHSVFYVTWYDAWAFSKFAHWDGMSCRLPHEDEWEKGAKGARRLEDCDWRYWWGDNDDESHRTCDLDFDEGVSSPPILYLNSSKGEGHKNPLGLIDILGNQWEWTADEYRREYSRLAMSKSDSTSRVCRGGGWSGNPSYVRASVRGSDPPAGLNYYIGFRLARA